MLEVKHLIKSYQNGEQILYALNNVSFSINPHEFVVIMGPSGSGKSTLLNAISGLEKPDSGEINYHDINIASLNTKQLRLFRRDKTAYIFQAYYLLPNLSVETNIRLGADLANNKDYQNIIKAVGLSGMEHRLPHQLSGGQQQRVSIARALAKKPEYLFCDEPTGALDENTSKQILTYLKELQSVLGFTIVMVTHHPGIAKIATKIIRLNSGNIVDITCNDSPAAINDVIW